MMKRPLPACACFVLTAAVAVSARAESAPYGVPTGQSWEPPALGEILHGADLLAECRVLAGGLFRAVVEPVVIYRGDFAFAGRALDVEGFNSYEWNTAYHAMREGDRLVLALFSPQPELGERAAWTLAAPSAGRFPIERGRVLAKLGRTDFLLELSEADFARAMTSCVSPERGAVDLARMLSADSLEVRYLSAVLLGELPEGGDAEDAVRALLALSRDPNPAMREAAADSLGRIGGAGAARALAEFLTDADRLVARAAARAVAGGGSHGAGRELAAWIARANPGDEKDAEVMTQALVFLARGRWLRGAPEVERRAVTAGLLDMVQAGDTLRARLSARVLGRLGASSAVPQLMRLLDSDAAELREEAALALLGITLAPEMIDADEAAKWWRVNGGRARSAWMDDGLARVGELAASDSGDDRRLAAAFIAESRHPLGVWAARGALAEGEGWSDGPVGALRGPLAMAFAEEALFSADERRRMAAIDCMTSFAEDVGPELCGWMKPSLGLALHDPSAQVSMKAARLTGEVVRTGAADALVERLSRAEGEEARVIARALRRATGRRFGFYVGRGYKFPEETRGIELWRRFVAAREKMPTADDRDAAGPLDRIAIEPSAFRRLINDDWTIAYKTVRGLPSGEIAALLSDADAIVRAFAAAACASAPSASAVDLKALLDDAEPIVRLQAAWALGAILDGSHKPPERLAEVAREGEGVLGRVALIALAKTGGDLADECFGELIEDGGAMLAVGALGLLDSPRSDELLLSSIRAAESDAALVARSLAARKPPGAAGPVLTRMAVAELGDAYSLALGLERFARHDDAGALAEALGSEDSIAAYAAARAIASMKPAPPAEVAEALMRALSSADEETARYAAIALAALAERGEMPEHVRPRATSSLLAMLLSSEFPVASSAAGTLEHAGSCAPGFTDAILRYRRAWRPQDPRALPALMRFGDERAPPMIEELAREGQWSDQYFATYSMRYHPDRARAAGMLLDIWRDRESPFAEAAAQSLASMGRDAVGPLSDLAHGGGEVAGRAVVLLGRLAEFAPDAAARTLESLARSADETVSRLARRELNRIR